MIRQALKEERISRNKESQNSPRPKNGDTDEEQRAKSMIIIFFGIKGGVVHKQLVLEGQTGQFRILLSHFTATT
jgi:hypothetical protein